MATKLHFWDDGDHSVGIGSNSTVIELELDGSSAEETAENISHAKEVLTKALAEIWDNGKVYAMTGAEVDDHKSERDPCAEIEVRVTIIASGDHENSPEEAVHYALSRCQKEGRIVAWRIDDCS